MKVGVLLLLPGLCLIVFGCSSKDTDTVRFVFAPDAIVRYMHDTGLIDKYQERYEKRIDFIETWDEAAFFAGGFMPYQVGRLDHGFHVRQETSLHIKKKPSEYLRRFYFDTITHAPAPLAFLVDLVGEDRVILGTDIPFDMADTDFGRIIEQAQLPPNTTTAIESGNAMELFNLS